MTARPTIAAPSPIPIGSIDEWGRVWDGVMWRCPVDIAEAPADGRIYGRQDQTWQLAIAAVNGEGTNLTIDDWIVANNLTVGTGFVPPNPNIPGQINTDTLYVNTQIDVGEGCYFGSDGNASINGTLSVYSINIPGTGVENVSGALNVDHAWIDNLSVANDLYIGGTMYSLNGVISGTLTVAGQVVTGSDAKLKKHIRNADVGLNALRHLRAKRYSRGGETELGLIAQDVQKIAPDAVQLIGKDRDTLGIDLTALIAILVNAVNELSEEVDKIKADRRRG